MTTKKSRGSEKQTITKDDVATVESTALAKTTAPGALAAVPDYLRGGKGRGMEDAESSDILLPRLLVLQDLSPHVKERRKSPAGVDYAAGQIINSLSGEIYEQPVKFIPVKFTKSRMMWGPRSAGKKVLCSSDDSKKAKLANGVGHDGKPTADCSTCAYAEFDETQKDPKDRKPKCTLYMNFPGMVPATGQPIAASFARGMIGTGKKLVTLAKYGGAALDLFAKVYAFVTFSDKRPDGEFWNLRVEGAGFVTEDQYALAEGFLAAMSTKRVTIDESGDEDESETSAKDEKDYGV